MSTAPRAISTKPEPQTEDRGISYLLASHIVHNLEKVRYLVWGCRDHWQR